MKIAIERTDVDSISRRITTLENEQSWEEVKVDSRLLYNALQSYLLLLLLNQEDLIDAADAAIWEHEHYKRGVMDIEEAARVAVSAAYKEIADNLWEQE